MSDQANKAPTPKRKPSRLRKSKITPTANEQPAPSAPPPKTKTKPKSLVKRRASNSAGLLLSVVERCERIEAERKDLSDDIKEILGEAKEAGFNPTIIRKAMSLRKMDPDKREEQEYLLNTYMDTLEDSSAASDQTDPDEQ